MLLACAPHVWPVFSRPCNCLVCMRHVGFGAPRGMANLKIENDNHCNHSKSIRQKWHFSNDREIVALKQQLRGKYMCTTYTHSHR